jgi:hypothetical protein
MKSLLALYLVLLLSSHYIFAQKIPGGSAPMIDGKHDAKEWDDARDIQLSNGFHLYIKKNDSFIFAAVVSPGDSIGYVSLYIETESTPITDLHSSARLGERTITDGRFKEWNEIFPDDSWFNNRDWISNYAWFKCRPPGCTNLKFAPSKEFQISRARFSGKQLKIFLVYSYIRQGKWENGKFPPNGTETKSDRWIVLDTGF